MRIYGVDFTSAPGQAKPIVCAVCELRADRLILQRVARLVDFTAFEQLLATPGPWVGGFDFPFGQPRELVQSLGLPDRWEDCCEAVRDMGAAAWRQRLDTFRAARAAGSKEPPRDTDRLAGAQSAMKAVNPPVAQMYLSGAPRLAAAGLDIVPCRRRADARVAIEAYPGLWARQLIGRNPYKSDSRSLQTPQRAANRRRLIERLSAQLPAMLGLQLTCSAYQERMLQADATGDRLDALLCAIQAAWAWQQPELAIPGDVDPLEGWIPLPGWLDRAPCQGGQKKGATQ
jgi:hypothetical protein